MCCLVAPQQPDAEGGKKGSDLRQDLYPLLIWSG